MSQPEISTAAMMEDRISSLPDDILIYILSSLHTKQASATSILSKRWKYLWCHVPVLDFNETKLEEDEDFESRFKDFLYSVLCLREAADNHSIHSFILDVEHNHYWERVPLWRICFEEFPNTIITCKTLVVLKLNHLYMGAKFGYNPIRLPSLKTLHLKHICFKQYVDLECLLEGCPVLEDLQLYDLSHTTLIYSKECCNTLTKLNRADIIECDCYIPMETLSNVEFLRIQLCRAYRHYSFATFHNLTHLVLNYNRDIVLKVLHHCPKLQNLDLYQKIQGKCLRYNYFDRFVDKKNWVHPKIVPDCLSLNLKTCTMRDFGSEDLQREHIMLARYILENSTVLETMSIWCFRNRSKVERQLFSCSRAATCKLSLYWEDIYIAPKKSKK